MSGLALLCDEHIPGPFIGVLRSTGYDVLRAKDEFSEGTSDPDLIEYARDTGRVVITCDKQFTVVDGEPVSDHGGVIYADQPALQRAPEAAAGGVDRIVSTIPKREFPGIELYLAEWS